MYAKNFLAYVSAREGVRKFEALQYAKHNYDHRNKLFKTFWPTIIDTYGYVKMAFEARKSSPNFDEIEESKSALQGSHIPSRSSISKISIQEKSERFV